jgi:hypothetical protein
LVALLIALVSLACRSDTEIAGPTQSGDNTGLVISSILAVEELAAAQVVGGASVVGSTTVYVSLLAGTVAGGVRAEITNLTTDLATIVPMVEGGFDPVAMPAEEGDKIEVITHTATGGTRRLVSTAGLSMRPVVIRSGPGRGAADVPLNALIVVVFSQPMEGSTLEDGGISLAGPSGRIPLTVDLGADGLTVSATPSEPLEPGTTYTVQVDTTATSTTGLGLEAPYETDFTTVALPFAFILGIGPTDTSFEAGSRVEVWVSITDANTGQLIEVPVHWTSSDPLVARVDGDGVVQSVGVGEVRIVAEIAGLSPAATLTFTPLAFTTVTSGGSHSCGITEQGSAFCWGSNTIGQLGTGDLEPRTLPTPVAGGLRFTAIAAGAEHTCGLTLEGTTYCWGSDEFWQLGRLDRQEPLTQVNRPSPMLLAGGRRFALLAAGGSHSCGTDPVGSTFCWGAFRYGNQALYLDGPQPLGDAPAFGVLSSGGNHGCGLVLGVQAYCWGRNDRGQLGDGSQTSRPVAVGLIDSLTRVSVVPVSSGLAFTSISAGSAHTCGVAAGRAYCWGEGGSGQLGAGGGFSVPFATTPIPVLGGLSFSSTSSGGRHSCGLDTGGNAYCWGANEYGQLGDGSRHDRPTPVTLADDLRFQLLATGADHGCGLATDGLLYCWGRSVAGEVGSGFTGVHERPTRVALQR